MSPLDPQFWAVKWNVELKHRLDGSTCSQVYLGQRNGTEVVLKVPDAHAEESRAARVLVAFAEHGGVPILEVDHATGAVLMPLLGVSLADSDMDEISQIRACARVIQQLRTCLSTEGVMTVADYNNENAGEGDLRRHAAEVAEALNASTPQRKLVHGDLHHGNILHSGSGWVAIDPKGLIGDPSFEITGYMRNPDCVIDKDLTRLRLRTFHEVLGDPIERLWGWAFAQSAVCGLGSEDSFTLRCRTVAEDLWELRQEFGWS